MSGKQIQLKEINRRIKELPIHSSKEIAADWNSISPKDRGRITKCLENAIINNKVKNQKEDIMKYLEIEE